MFPEDELEEMKSLHGEISVGLEGNEHFILVHKTALPDGCSPAVTGVLFFPNKRDGYNGGRLYFPSRVKNGPNWTAPALIQGTTWHAYSWQAEPGGRLAQKFAVLLRGLR